jgi:dihydrofolate synthase/folylpolyglutamate synthase
MNKTLEFLYSLRNQGSKFGIERMQSLCEELGNPQVKYRSIHVAGTNGKGSVCTMLDNVYRTHGYRVGLFTSPHLLELGERIRVNGKNLPFEEIEQWVNILMPVVEKVSRQGQGPTFFELITAIAFMEFEKQQVEIAIVETGLGGRLDSTNVLNSDLSVITSVGYDHCEMLGNKLDQIAREKAGIIKPGKPVVVGWLEKKALDEVVQKAEKKKAPLHLMEKESGPTLPETNLHGSFQQKNAALARRATELLQPLLPVQKPKVVSALKTVQYPGRWQQISSEPTIILDACHNGQGAEVSEELWDRLPQGFEVWFAACGKDRAQDVLTPLLLRTNSVTLFEIDQPRSCTHQDLQKLVQDYEGKANFARESDIPKLFQVLDSQSTLLVTGSIYLIASVLASFQEHGEIPLSGNLQDHW